VEERGQAHLPNLRGCELLDFLTVECRSAGSDHKLTISSGLGRCGLPPLFLSSSLITHYSSLITVPFFGFNQFAEMPNITWSASSLIGLTKKSRNLVAVV
jgi:hypothetical protein